MTRPGSRTRWAIVAMFGSCAGVAVIVAVAAGAASVGPRSSAVNTSVGAVPASTVPAGATTPALPSFPTPTTARARTLSPGVLHFEGSHQGVEHFAIATSHCPEVDSGLAETFILTDGSSWSYDTRYCGTIVGSLWSGSGPFSMTAKDGSQFTGTHTNSAFLPSPGVPYELDVTGGTKRFAGASGSCVIEERLRQTQFGVQLHSGSFACDLKTN